ncbi:MAG: hypothetical protein ABI743_12465 [bacterium]
MPPFLAQVGELLRLRLRVTWRTYTATFTARMESLLFLPTLFMGAWGTHQILFYLLSFVLDPHMNFRTLSVNLVMLMHVTLLLLFIGWSVVPALGLRTNESLDINRLRMLPLPLSRLYTATVLGYALDLSTIMPFAMATAIVRFVAGVVEQTQHFVLTPGLFGILLLIGFLYLVLLLVGSLLMVQIFQVLLPRLDLTKALLIGFLACVAWAVALNLELTNMGDGATLFEEWRYVDRYNRLPTGPFALALHELSQRNLPLVWRFIGEAVGWIIGGLACSWAMMAIAVDGKLFGLERWFNTERFAWIAAPRTAGGVARGWPLWVTGAVRVIAWKDAQALLRNHHFFFYKMLPGVLAPTVILLIGKYNLRLLADQHDLLAWFIPLYLGLSLMIFITQANLFIANYFGFERDQIPALLSAPVPRREIIWGKNLFLLILMCPDILIIASLAQLLLPHLQLGLWFLTVGVLLSIVLNLLGIGNLASILLPYYAPLDRPVITLQGAVLVGLANTAILITLALCLIPDLILLLGPAYGWQMPWSYVLTVPLWALYHVVTYTLLSNWAARLMPQYEEWIQLRVRGVL